MRVMQILIVDDDSDFAETMGLVFEGRGHVVEIAHSGEDAIEKQLGHGYDLIFMDQKLPGKSGLDSLLEMRKTRPTARIVMITGFSTEEHLIQAAESGAWGVLQKPLDIPEALALIDRIES